MCMASCCYFDFEEGEPLSYPPFHTSLKMHYNSSATSVALHLESPILFDRGQFTKYESRNLGVRPEPILMFTRYFAPDKGESPNFSARDA